MPESGAAELESDCTGERTRDGGLGDVAASLAMRAFSMLRLTLRLCIVVGDIPCSKTERDNGGTRLLGL